jgi:phage terminase large subunit
MSQAVCCWCKSPLVQAEGVYWCGGSIECRTRQAEWGIDATDKKTGERRWIYLPTPKQVDFHVTTRRVRRTLYGGQAGPGKSHAIRKGLERDCLLIPNLNCLLLRRTYQQLEQTHLLEMMREAPELGAVYTSGDKVMRFPNGSVIRAGHCETAVDAMNYLSTEYDRIAFDELVTFDRDMALEIMSRARTSKPAVMAAGDAQVWAGTNPGGRGALWVKEFFIEHAVDRAEFPSYDPERYAFVEASLSDNPYISSQYRRDLEDLPEMRKRQLLYGDWNAFEGQFFSEWRADVHIVNMPIERGIEHFGSMDWGYSSPGVMLWWAALPDGKYHVRYEHKFKGDTAEAVGKRIRKITADLGIDKLRYIAADPGMWQKTGAGRGEAIAETLLRMRLPMRKSDNDRKNGWLRLHELLKVDDDSERKEPWLTVAPECKYLIRTLPAMVQDDHEPEDIDTAKDDHAADALRYGAMSRPSPTRFNTESAVKPGTIAWWKLNPTGRPVQKGVLA